MVHGKNLSEVFDSERFLFVNWRLGRLVSINMIVVINVTIIESRISGIWKMIPRVRLLEGGSTTG